MKAGRARTKTETALRVLPAIAMSPQAEVVDYTQTDTQPNGVDGLGPLLKACRMRRQYLRAAQRLNQQIWAIEHPRKHGLAELEALDETQLAETSELTAQLRLAEAVLKQPLKDMERHIIKLAKGLPVFQWISHVDRRGIGPLGLGLVLGEIGDLSGYANPAKVWKRMGLAVVEGQRQRCVSGTTETKTLLAIEMGYSPRRRAVMAVLGDSLIKQNMKGPKSKEPGPYRALYLERKAFELDRLPSDGKTPTGHAHNRALRYMEKRFLLDLWRAWRAETKVDLSSMTQMSQPAGLA